MNKENMKAFVIKIPVQGIKSKLSSRKPLRVYFDGIRVYVDIKQVELDMEGKVYYTKQGFTTIYIKQGSFLWWINVRTLDVFSANYVLLSTSRYIFVIILRRR